MKAPVPNRKVLKPVFIEVPEDGDKNEEYIAITKSQLKRIIADIFVKMDAHYVRKSDLKREIQLALQDIVKSKISPEGA